MNKVDYQGWELESFDNSKNFREYQVSLIRKNLKGYIAEVGPGNGEILQTYKNDFDKIDLFEPSEKLFQNLKIKFKNLNNINIKNKEFTLQTNTYDTIIYLDVLEHIKEDEIEIQKAFNSLRPEGKLIINVPAFQHLFSNFDKDVNHFRRYDKKKIFKLLKNIRYSSLEMNYYDSIGYLLSLFSKIFFVDYKINFKKKIKIWNKLIPVSKILDKFLLNSFGKSLIIIVKK